MKTLYLLRHAKAEPGSKVVSDPARALAPRGHEACAAVGAYMKAKAYVPDSALSSPSVRTRETLEHVSEAAGIAPPCRFEDALYLASAEEIIRFVREADERFSSLLVVGHNPGMHHAALLLAGLGPSPLRKALELKYPTCALSVLRFKSKYWSHVVPSEGSLVDFVTPEEL